MSELIGHKMCVCDPRTAQKKKIGNMANRRPLTNSIRT